MDEKPRQGGFGEKLRAAREAAGIDLRELSNTTKVQVRYIEALETETWSRVPGGVIGRGFVRLISREVGADVEQMVQLYMSARGEDAPASMIQPPDTQWKSGRIVPKIQPKLFLLIGLAVLVLGIVSVSVWKFCQPPPPPKAAEVQGQLHRLDIKALQNTWVRVKAKGLPEEKNVVGAGETMSFEVEEAEVEMPDASALQIIWDGVGLKQVAGVGEAAKVRLPREVENLKP